MTAKSIILPATNAPALANYPHAKQVGQTIYLSGISSRNPDNKTWKGVTERADGSVDLDIREQSRAVIEKYLQKILTRTLLQHQDDTRERGQWAGGAGGCDGVSGGYEGLQGVQ